MLLSDERIKEILGCDFIRSCSPINGVQSCEQDCQEIAKAQLQAVVDDLRQRAGKLHICHHHPHLPCPGCELHKIADSYEQELK